MKNYWIACIALLFLNCTKLESEIPPNDFTPKFSPNGEQIVFYRYIDKVPELMVINTDGKRLRQLTEKTGLWSIGPNWSKSGNQLIFSQGKDMGSLNITYLDLGSGEVTTLQRDNTQFALGSMGNNVLWASRENEGTTFYRSDGYGSSEKEAIEVEGFDDYWVFPHRESSSIFIQVNDEDQKGLYLIKDGDTPVKILEMENLRNLVVSADGQKIVFEANDGDNTDIYLSDIDGANLTRLTTHEYPDYMPDFSPDGNAIVFSSARSGFFCLYLLDIHTKELTQLTGV